MWQKWREELYSNGVTVIPILQPPVLQSFHQDFLREVENFPEYNPGSNEARVYGSFGALGNPASFHNLTVRKLRLGMMEYARYLFATIPAVPTHIEQLIDRMSIRKTGTQVPKETWHRDIAPNQHPGDQIFGGWLNLDLDQCQYFSCMLGSHLDQAGQHAVMEVPPGCWIIFYQNILHEVHCRKMTRDSIKLYLGFRLTNSTVPLYQTEEALTKQGVPTGPSGQTPEMFFANHLRFHGPKVRQWSNEAFKPICRNGDLVHSPMKSLREYNLPLYPEYEQKEKDILRPLPL